MSSAHKRAWLLPEPRSIPKDATPRKPGEASEMEARKLLALLKYPFYPLFILDNGMNSISKSLTVLTPA